MNNVTNIAYRSWARYCENSMVAPQDLNEGQRQFMRRCAEAYEQQCSNPNTKERYRQIGIALGRKF